ncbi:MAG TPA: hypothetical protein VJ691_11145 [Vicinamibacterales bacterium]|nr:hypothetical protein [Vicinamibacterales bacterium]
MLETGLLLILIPWSAFWERNYFFEWSAAFSGVMTSNYMRGAISGLGLINVWAALGELADIFGRPNPQSDIRNQQ